MKILLVIDIQEKYLSYYDADLLNRINARIIAAKSENTNVFYVRNIGSQGDNDSYALAKELLKYQTISMKRNSPVPLQIFLL